MAKILPCPRCDRNVSIPVDVLPTARVRCPHCKTDYALDEALDYVPPLLMLVTDEDLLVEAGGDETEALCEMPALVHPDRYEEGEPQVGEELIIEDDAAGEGFASAPSEEPQATIPFERADEFRLSNDDVAFSLEESELKFDELPSVASTGDDAEIAGEYPVVEEPLESLPLDRAGTDLAEFNMAGPFYQSGGIGSDGSETTSSGDVAADEQEPELEFDTELDTQDRSDDASPRVMQMEDDGELRFDAGEDSEDEIELESSEFSEAAGRPVEEDFDEVSFESPEIDQPDFSFDRKEAPPTPVVAASMAGGIEAPRLRGKPPKRRESSFLVTVIGYLVSAVIGLGLGYVVLLWSFPVPETDVLHVARYLPGWMVPASVETQSASNPVAVADISNPAPVKGDVEKRLNEPGSPFAEVEPKPSTSPPNNYATRTSATEAVPIAPTEPQPNGKAAALAPAEPAEEQKPVAEAPPVTNPPATPPSATVASTVKKPAIDPSTAPPATAKPTEEPKSPPTASAVGPRAAPQFSASDVKKSLADVRLQASNVLPGADKRKAKLQFYKKLYNLAAALTLAKDGQQEAELAAVRAEVQKLVRDLVSGEDSRKEMTYVAMQWLSRPAAKRGEHQGVVLIGKVQQVTPRGPVEEIGLKPEGWPHTVNIVTTGHVSLAPQTNVVVIGMIVDDPAGSLEGYQGSAKQVVWTDTILPAGE